MKYYTEFDYKKIKHNRTGYIKNILSLDFESSSIFNCDNKLISFNFNEKPEYYNHCVSYGIAYIWMIGIDNEAYYGRTLNELKDFIEQICYNSGKCNVVIYVHNLSFDFQYLRNIFKFDVFARTSRKVMCCKVVDMNVEFRCAYMLSGLSLDKLAKEYCKKTRKLVGDLDYHKIRTPKTPLNEKELKYCENDVLILNEYISIMLKRYKSFKYIPLTSTGIIRRELRKYIGNNYRDAKNQLMGIRWWEEYVSKMTGTFYEFTDLVECCSGGYVHANPWYVGKTLENLKHNDFDSSYIFVLLSEKFPMEPFEKCDNDEIIDTENYSYIIEKKYYNIESECDFNFIQFTKVAKNVKGFINDNGRIVCADELVFKGTDVDIDIIESTYSYAKSEVISIKKAKKNYLPKVLIEFITELYLKKKDLKQRNKEGEDVSIELSETKKLLCSCYGMMITNNIRDKIIYNENGWDIEELKPLDISNILLNKRKDKKEFLNYAWGVWVSAYARRNLFKIIKHIDQDGVYCDTDSLFYFGDYDYFVDSYNKECDDKIRKMFEYYDIEINTNIFGLGYFDKEEDCEKFRTLGAKKYLAQIKGKKVLTLSGVNKEQGVKAIKDFKDFKSGFIFDYQYSGKNIVLYNDNQEEITITDYLGNTETVKQKYGVILQPTTYRLSCDNEYVEYISSDNLNVPVCNFLSKI